MNWSDLIVLRIIDGGIELRVGVLLLVAIIIGVGFILFLRNKLRPRQYDMVSIELGFGNVGKVNIRPNNDVVQIAHQVWTELVTRKAGLEFDADHDLIVEVYDSWYQLFGRIRDSLRAVPAHRLRTDPNTRTLIEVLVKAMNNGLRPHLTKWQARFRAWYAAQVKEQRNLDRAPQEIQRGFKDYEALVADLRQANQELVQLAKALHTIAQGV